MDILDKYRQLSLNLSCTQKLIRELEFYAKHTPVGCPMRTKIQQNLDGAMQLKREIKSDINQLADTIDFKLKWRPAQ